MTERFAPQPGRKRFNGKSDECWKRDYLLLFGLTLAHHCAVVCFFAFPLQVVAWGYGVMSVALLAFAMDITVVGVRPLVKWLLDTFSARAALVLASLFLLITPFVMAWAGSSLPLLVLGRMCHGLSLSLLLVGSLVYAHAALPPPMARRGILWLGVTSMLPYLFMVSVAEKTIMNGRIDIFYAILAFLGLTSLFFSVFLKPYRAVSKHRVTMKGLVSVPAFRGLLMLAFSGAMVICVTNNFMALLLVERGIPVSAFFIPFALATLTLRGPLAFWVERCDPRRVVVACFVVMAAAVLGEAFSMTGRLFVVFALLHGVGFGPLEPVIFSFTAELFPHDRNAVFTGVMTAEDAAWASGPLLGGLMGSVSVVFAWVGAAGLAGFAALGSARWLFTRDVARRMVRHKRETHG